MNPIHLLKKTPFFFNPLRIGVVFLALGSGCERSIEAICGDFSQVIEGVEQNQLSLVHIEKEKSAGGRRIASVSEHHEEQRARWLEWSESLLKDTHRVKEQMQEKGGMRKGLNALNDASLALISFHGYIEQRKWKKAHSTLEIAKDQFAKAHQVACPKREPASEKVKKRARK